MTATSPSSRTFDQFLFIALAAGCLFLSVQYGIAAWRRGVIHYDEAYYLLEARGIVDGLHHLSGIVKGTEKIETVKAALRDSGDIFPPGAAKPVYTLLLCVLAALPVPLDIAAREAGWIILALSSGLIYFCGRQFGVQRPLALLVAALFFASPLSAYYGISGYPNSLAAALYLLGVYFYLKERWPLSGLFLSLAVLTHYGFLPTIGLTVGWILFDRVVLTQPRRMKAAGLFVLSFAVPPLLLEGLYRIVGWLLRPHLNDVFYFTYFQQIQRQLDRSTTFLRSYGDCLRHNLSLFRDLAKLQGSILSAMLLVALAWGWIHFRRGSRPAQGMIVIATGTLLFWILDPGVVVSRTVVFLLPALYLCLFTVLSENQSTDLPRVEGLLLVVMIVLAGACSLAILPRLRSPFPEAARMVSADPAFDGTVIDSFSWPVWQYYLHRRMNVRSENIVSATALRPNLNHLMEKTGTSMRPAVILHGQINPVGPTMDTFAFYKGFLDRAPDRHWDTDYGSMPIYYGEEAMSPAAHFDQLSLYWLTPEDLKRL